MRFVGEKTVKKTILLVEDDPLFQRSMENLLREHYQIEKADSIKEGLEKIKNRAPHLILLDLKLTDGSGMELLDFIQQKFSHIPVIVLSAFDDVPQVVAAMKKGAHHYLTKDSLSEEELLLITQKALANFQMREELEHRKILASSQSDQDQFIGRSPGIQKVKDQIEIAAKVDSTVLIEGETGTGKEIVARQIHNKSPRRDRLFVPVNCGSLPKELVESELFGHARGASTGAGSGPRKGKFQLANEGTLLLDEIGELSLDLQVKLLRVLEESEFYSVGSDSLIKVNVRVLASTNRSLSKMVEEGTF